MPPLRGMCMKRSASDGVGASGSWTSHGIAPVALGARAAASRKLPPLVALFGLGTPPSRETWGEPARKAEVVEQERDGQPGGD